MKIYILKALFLVICLFAWNFSDIVVSEVMGDPSYLSDAEGEYLELINTGDKAVLLDSLTIIVNGNDPLRIDNISFEAREIYLICRDSSTMAQNDIYCGLEWPDLGISNQSNVTITLGYSSSLNTFHTEKPLSGKSWENTLDKNASFQTFRPAVQNSLGGDFGSPGLLFSGSMLPLNKDLGISALTANGSGDPSLVLGIINSGREVPGNTLIKIEQDLDWDGTADALIDTFLLAPIPGPGQEIKYTWTIPGKEQAVYMVTLSNDDNNANNSASALFHPSPSLTLTEICPNPPETFPEWLEIKNSGDHEISLQNIFVNGISLNHAGKKPVSLRPGEFALITESIEKFNQTHPVLSLILIEMSSWDVLRNTGDSIVISAYGNTMLDSITYPSQSAGNKGLCIVRDQNNPGQWYPAPMSSKFNDGTQESSSPGFETPQAKAFNWSISPEIIDISRHETFSIKIESPLSSNYSVKIFDLTGYEAAVLCKDCSGKKTIQWDGKRDTGEMLPIGPYICTIKADGQNTIKKPLILARPL